MDPISLDTKFQPIPTYHDKDYNTSWCKNLKLDSKLDYNLIKPSYIFIDNSVLDGK
jgi:hypothetical protein